MKFTLAIFFLIFSLIFAVVPTVTPVAHAQVKTSGGGGTPPSPIVGFGNAVSLKNTYGSPIQLISLMRGSTIFGPSFTVEFWLKLNKASAYNNQTLFRIGHRLNVFTEKGSAGSDSKLALIGNNGQTQKALIGSTIPVGKWNHIAISYVKATSGNEGTFNLYINGTNVAAGGKIPFLDSTDIIEIGQLEDSEIDEIRISNTARYTGDTFTTPTEPYLPDDKTTILWHLNGDVSDTTGNGYTGQTQGNAPFIDSTVPYSRPPLTLPVNNKISWKTGFVSLEADNFYIIANGKVFKGADAKNIRLISNPTYAPNFDYTTLEATWQENGVEMRINMYFDAYMGKWEMYEMRTYNGNQPGDWNYYPGITSGICAQGGGNPNACFTALGKPYIASESKSGDLIYNGVYFKNLKLQAFLDRPTQVPGITKFTDITGRYTKTYVWQGDRIYIQGYNFSKVASENKVYFGDVPMIPSFYQVSADGKTLSFVVDTETVFKIGQMYKIAVENPVGRSAQTSILLSSPTQLDQYYPNIVTPGNKITLKGKNFGDTQGSVFVYNLLYRFATTALVNAWTNNSITIIVPALSATGLSVRGGYPPIIAGDEYQFVVNGTYANTSIFSSNPIKLRIETPKLEKILPNNGNVNQVVTLWGQGFGTQKGSVAFYYNGQVAAGAVITLWTDRQIFVKVPAIAGKREYQVEVTTEGGQKTNKTSFKINGGPPQITSISVVDYTSKGQPILSITGQELGQQRGTFYISYNGKKINTTGSSWSENAITLTVPSIVPLGHTFEVYIRTYDGRETPVKFINL